MTYCKFPETSVFLHGSTSICQQSSVKHVFLLITVNVHNYYILQKNILGLASVTGRNILNATMQTLWVHLREEKGSSVFLFICVFQAEILAYQP